MQGRRVKLDSFPVPHHQAHDSGTRFAAGIISMQSAAVLSRVVATSTPLVGSCRISSPIDFLGRGRITVVFLTQSHCSAIILLIRRSYRDARKGQTVLVDTETKENDIQSEDEWAHHGCSRRRRRQRTTRTATAESTTAFAAQCARQQ